MAGSRSLVVALVGLGGAAALLVAGERAAEPPPGGAAAADSLAPIAAEIDGRLRETAAGLAARATTLAELPRLASAVATDAATVRDLTQEELAFRPRPGERIAIAQVPNGGKPVVLFRTSDGAGDGGVDAGLDRPGVRLEVRGGALLLTDVLEVRPRDRADELKGAIAVSWPVDLAGIAARLDGMGRAARLEVGAGAVALSARALPDGARTTVLPLASEPGAGARLVVEAAPVVVPSPGLRGPLRAAAAALALLALVAAALLRRAPKPASVTAPAAGGEAAPGTSPGFAPTQLAPQVTRDLAAGRATGPAMTRPLAGATAAAGPATQIGRYTIVRELGAGGMAVVYLARSTGEAGFEKLFALKVMLRSPNQHPDQLDHFLDEARLASRLDHPNIVQISDLGRAGDDYFIAMEYVDGLDLSRLLATTRELGIPVPPRVGFNLVRKICDGLHAAHTATGPDGAPLELVHRDVKSANVFVARSGAVKVGDFGIAKANQAARAVRTEVGLVKGTAAYMAPEHRIGTPVDRRADVYSVGVIAYEVFSGKEVDLDLARLAHLGREGWPHLAPLASLRADLPPGLDAIVFKALAYERDDRWATCDAFEAALDELATRSGLVAGEKVVAQWVEGLAGGAAAPSSAAPAS